MLSAANAVLVATLLVSFARYVPVSVSVGIRSHLDPQTLRHLVQRALTAGGIPNFAERKWRW